VEDRPQFLRHKWDTHLYVQVQVQLQVQEKVPGGSAQ
jgi:hypothetical protein